jgi:NAD(P)-dependent dehydrogenase (short-subunit alcohol dehydrogenase family)
MASVLDSALDAMIVPGFSRIGFAVRSRSFGAIDGAALVGKTIVLTGHTSGIGFAAAMQMRALGADLVLVGRDASRSAQAARRIEDASGSGRVTTLVADMGDLDQVGQLALAITSHFERIDVVVHNAGALLKVRERTLQGHDTTIAVHVLGPFLLTHSLLAPLAASGGRVITVASGGMYAAGLPAFVKGHDLELPDAKYDGTRQYAIAKRAQVTLNEMWAVNPAAHGVGFHTMHPGWADTPGVSSSIPVFRAVTKPILRTPDQAADTVTWLAATDAQRLGTGGFWCDRERRPIHRLASTRRSDTKPARDELWKRVEGAALGSGA